MSPERGGRGEKRGPAPLCLLPGGEREGKCGSEKPKELEGKDLQHVPDGWGQRKKCMGRARGKTCKKLQRAERGGWGRRGRHERGTAVSERGTGKKGGVQVGG